MAAEALESKGAAMGVDIKIETNGSGGVKNHLTAEDIERAVGVIVACDKDVPTQRFAGKPVVFTKVANGIKIPEELIQTDPSYGNGPYFPTAKARRPRPYRWMRRKRKAPAVKSISTS
mgnify:CR=1 FL=1